MNVIDAAIHGLAVLKKQNLDIVQNVNTQNGIILGWLEEKYLRNRVRIVDGTYKTGMFRNRYIENTPTCHKFLYCDPRPTEEELLRVLNADAINAKGKEFSTESLPISLIFDQHKMLLINAVSNITNNNNKNSVKE